MSKWKVLDIFKKKRIEVTYEKKSKVEESKDKKDDNGIVVEYSDIIYSNEELSDKDLSLINKSKMNSDQRIWRDIDGIEKNIDNLDRYKSKGIPVDESLDKKIDNVLDETKKHRKPSNVIYVVSKPQPGQVKGDWAVRSHGKIFSHHRIKENAIKKAREIARKRDATVLVQNTDGTFSEGFKPRSK